jgi:hypothetical protein
MPQISIKVATDFSRYPGGRFKQSSDCSGEEFREKFLEPHLVEDSSFAIDLNNLFAIPPSFLDESFGKIIEQIGVNEFQRRFTLHLDDDDDAKRELKDIIRRRGESFDKKIRK